jgi:HAD superfamily hydrolase (TIGR01450 family)
MMPHSTESHDPLRAGLHGIRGLLLDLDGVLILRGAPIAGAAEAIRELDRRGFPFIVVTNTSLYSRSKLASWVARHGMPIPADRFQTALSASAALVNERYAGRAVYVIASDDARSEFDGSSAVLLDAPGAAAAERSGAPVAAVVLGDSPDQLTKPNLDRAFRLVRNGADLIGMHRNPWWLTPEGPVLDAGTFLVGLEWATKRRAQLVGKPSPAFFRLAIARLSAEAAARGEPVLLRRDLAMVGDDLGTDIAGGRRAGLRTVFVRTGKHGDAELAAAARARRPVAPDVTAPSIAEVVAALA